MPWLDALVQGLLLGGMYAQYALGMALMFGVMRIVNTAHGDLMVLLALMGVSLAGALAVGPHVVVAMLVPIAAVLGWLLQRLVLNRVLGNDPLPSLIATYGLSIALQNLMLQVWSADTRSLPGDGLEFASIALGDLFIGVLPLQIFTAALLMSAVAVA
jgi:branched-chain amino acid transport system permease protein